MEFNIKTTNQTPVLWSDNFFSEDEIGVMKKECDKIRVLNLFSNDTGSAKADGVIQSKNDSVFLEKLYNAEIRLSDTINVTRIRLFDPKFQKYLVDIHPYFITLTNLHISNGATTLLSYYDDSQYYKPHRDLSFVTVITWFYENPKAFEGGDFIIENDIKIECKHGRTVFMPSYLLHEVTPVTMPEDKQGKGLGRYSISNFMQRV